jgi:TPR repeat protein
MIFKTIILLVIPLSLNAAENIQTKLKRLDAECEKGKVKSCSDIAYIYDAADLVKYDPHKSIKYWTKGCDGGIGDNCYSLAILYDEGTHGENKIVPDRVKAKEALVKGCKLKNEDCCSWLKRFDDEL